MHLWKIALPYLLGLFVAWRLLPGALCCLFPRRVRLHPLDPESKRIDAPLFEAMTEELAPAGLRPLGAHLEGRPLRRTRVIYDFYLEEQRTFASAEGSRAGARLTLLTPFHGGAFVLTADHARPAAQRPLRYLAGGIAAKPEQVVAAHRRRVEQFEAGGLTPSAEATLASRLQAERDWLSGPGGRELRLANLTTLLLFLFGAAILAALVK